MLQRCRTSLIILFLGLVPQFPERALAQKAPPGFKVDLLYKAPDIEHPSVVTCDDQGNLFVGENPMDMRGPPNKPIDRILYLRWDKTGGPPRKTVFCDKLSAVFGMVWHQGVLYVMHVPNFSMFIDTDGDGVADVRKDLITTLGHPAGKFGLSNHSPTGMQLGIDGLIYVSVGDKGIPKATGADGSTITLEGGGIIRMRPDGTRLEVVSSGIRNHLDLALDSFDNIFAYENDDDIGWPVQMFHHIPTGYFGYPYYRQRRPGPRLPAVADLGDGTPCGAAAYREASWPDQYRERVFFGEWGKSKIECFTFTKKGASFAAKVDDFFLGDGSGDFRPLDLCFSPDGKHMYVADWNFAAGGKPDKVGRLFRVSYVGHDAQPEPSRARDTDPLAAQLRALAHPARSERLRAQYRLAALGKAAAGPVASQLTSNTSSLGKIHAIWTLHLLADRLPGFDPAEHWLKALDDADAEVRAQAARVLGYRRVRSAAGPLVRTLAEKDAAARMQAAIALGRIGQSSATVPLVKALGEQDAHARFAMIQALRAINHWNPVLAMLPRQKKPVRMALLQALAGVYDIRAVKILEHWLREAPEPAERVEALEALAEVHRRADPYTGGWWGGKPAAGKFGRPKIHAWAGTRLVDAALAGALQQNSPEVRLAAIKSLREVPAAGSLPLLRHLALHDDSESLRREAIVTLAARQDLGFMPALLNLASSADNSEGLRQEAIRAAVTVASGEVPPCLIRIVEGKETTPKVVAAALEGLGILKVKQAAGTVAARLNDPVAEVRLKAIQAYAQVSGKAACPHIVPKLKDAEPAVRRTAIEVLGRIGSHHEVPALLSASGDLGMRFEATLALAAIPDPRALAVYLDGLQHKSPELRTACRRAVTRLGDTIRQDLQALHDRNELPATARGELQTAFAKKRETFAFLFETKVAKLDPAAFAEFAGKNHGNVGRGRQLFADPKGCACAKCHAIGGEGGIIGPDLNSVGARYPRTELIRSVLEPSNRIVDGYEMTIIATTSGIVHQGIIKSQTPEKTVLMTTEGQAIEIMARDIEDQKRSNLSPMPSGLAEGMTLQDFADLIAYLESLKAPEKK